MMTASSSSSSSTASGGHADSVDDVATAELRQKFERWLLSTHPTSLRHLRMQLNVSGRDPNLRRGLIANLEVPAGTIMASIPMHTLALSSRTLTASLERHSISRFGQRESSVANGPQHGWYFPPFSPEYVMKFLYGRGIADPSVYPQVFLAMLLAAERMQPDSGFGPYLDFLPHPAIDDTAVMMLHKDMLDPTQLLEWDSHQHEFTSIVKLLHAQWEHLLKHSAQRPPVANLDELVPPVQVMYWAVRTVFARHFQLPRDGITPRDAGSKLDMYTFGSVKEATTDTSALSRLIAKVKQAVQPQTEQREAFNNYQLEPMLVPLVDIVGHVAPANVAFGVNARPGLGPCVELTAVDRIKEGEEIGAPYNSCHSVAFTLYRFGFLPI